MTRRELIFYLVGTAVVAALASCTTITNVTLECDPEIFWDPATGAVDSVVYRVPADSVQFCEKVFG